MASHETTPGANHPDAAANVPVASGKLTLGPEYQLGSDLPQALTAISKFINGDNASESEAKGFLEKAEKFDSAFRQQYEQEGNKLNAQKRGEQVTWVLQDQSEQGSHILENVTKSLANIWLTCTRKGVPGQDKAHIMEDMRSEFSAMIDYARSGQADGFHKIAAIPGFSHDLGRIAEEKLLGGTTGGEMGKKHAMISGMLLNAVLEHVPTIPAEIHNQMVYAALAHQDWVKDKDSLRSYFTNGEPTSQEVRKIERMGLIGPHAIQRMLAYDVGANPAKSLDIATKINPERKVKLDSTNNTDLAHHIEFYMRNLDPVEVDGAPQSVNEAMNNRADELKAISGTFLYLASSNEIRDQIFAPEKARDKGEPIDENTLTENKKKPLSPKVWNLIKAAVAKAEADPTIMETSMHMGVEDLAYVVANMGEGPLWLKAAAKIKEKLKAVTDPEAQKRLAFAFEYAYRASNAKTKQEDQLLALALADTQAIPPHSVERALTEFIANFNGIQPALVQPPTQEQQNQQRGNNQTRDENRNQGKRRQNH